jgi:glycosidase
MKANVIFFFCVGLLFSCGIQDQKKPVASDPYQPRNYVELKHPEWSRSATIYEVNIRQFTKEGTFKAFEQHLLRLKKLGVDIIWLMPIHPIGEKNRKGTLGSYYSVKDYYGVNPEFGSAEDFKNLVDKIHEMGMYVIIDWVANHSAWDNKLVTEHPEWYTKNEDGNFQPTPWYDWDDIIDFDFNNPAFRKYMADALCYWVKEADIDGYRCDVAGFIPVDFWDHVRERLDSIKPVFMLAEWESRDLHRRAFDMTYAWSLWDKMKLVAQDPAHIHTLYEYMAHHVNSFPADAYRMTFLDNHDKNSWEGNLLLNFGKALDACIVFTCTVEGMPLIYSGQEAGLNRSLKFFDKDEIEWKDHPHAGLYQQLFELKKRNKALWNGSNGGYMIPVKNDQPKSVISFARQKDDDKIIALFNFNNKPVKTKLSGKFLQGDYTELFTKQLFTGYDEIELPAHGYRVFSNR